MLHDDMGKRKKKDWKQKKSAYDQVTDDEMRGGDEGVGSRLNVGTKERADALRGLAGEGETTVPSE